MSKVAEVEAPSTEVARCEARGKRHSKEDPGTEGLIRRKRLTLGPHRRHPGEAMEVDGLSTGVEGAFLVYSSKGDKRGSKQSSREDQH